MFASSHAVDRLVETEATTNVIWMHGSNLVKTSSAENHFSEPQSVSMHARSSDENGLPEPIDIVGGRGGNAITSKANVYLREVVSPALRQRFGDHYKKSPKTGKFTVLLEIVKVVESEYNYRFPQGKTDRYKTEKMRHLLFDCNKKRKASKTLLTRQDVGRTSSNICVDHFGHHDTEDLTEMYFGTQDEDRTVADGLDILEDLDLDFQSVASSYPAPMDAHSQYDSFLDLDPTDTEGVVYVFGKRVHLLL